MVALWNDARAEQLEEPPAEHLRNARALVQLMVVDARVEGNHGGRMTLEAVEDRLTKAQRQTNAVYELRKSAAGVRISDVGLLERTIDRVRAAGFTADAARLEQLAGIVAGIVQWRAAADGFFKVGG